MKSHIETISVSAETVPVLKSDVSVVIGYESVPVPLEVDVTIDEVLSSAGKLCDLRGGYGVIDPVGFDDENGTLILDTQAFDTRKVVFQQLRKAERIAVFACTAGNGIIETSRRLMKEGDYLRGYIYDVYGSLVVEGAMDIVQARLKTEMKREGLKITNRYSPGYCGWDVSEQKKLFSLLPENFCGIELTDSCLMRPIKSVSGIIGIGKSVKFNSYTCNICDDSNCLYRNLKRRDAFEAHGEGDQP